MHSTTTLLLAATILCYWSASAAGQEPALGGDAIAPSEKKMLLEQLETARSIGTAFNEADVVGRGSVRREIRGNVTRSREITFRVQISHKNECLRWAWKSEDTTSTPSSGDAGSQQQHNEIPRLLFAGTAISGKTVQKLGVGSVQNFPYTSSSFKKSVRDLGVLAPRDFVLLSYPAFSSPEPNEVALTRRILSRSTNVSVTQSPENDLNRFRLRENYKKGQYDILEFDFSLQRQFPLRRSVSRALKGTLVPYLNQRAEWEKMDVGDRPSFLYGTRTAVANIDGQNVLGEEVEQAELNWTALPAPVRTSDADLPLFEDNDGIASFLEEGLSRFNEP